MAQPSARKYFKFLILIFKMLLPFFPGPGAETGPFSPSDLEMQSQKVKTSYNNNISYLVQRKVSKLNNGVHFHWL